ncbi:putative aminotransferase family protein [Xylaria sp. CBS 124048]|nr:putative aminotransferase family protein [Xylaria sp. CBS 124048]
MTPSEATPSGPIVPFGRAMRDAYFCFSPDYHPLNHGSYGTYPTTVRQAHQALQALVESAPDRFIALDWPSRLSESRTLTAAFLHCPAASVVFVPNATTGIETVLKNLVFAPGDVVLVYECIYASVRANLAWLEETTPLRVEVVAIPFPVGDDAFVEAMVGAARAINAGANGRGERVRLAIVDVVVSLPGLRTPFERLVPALQAEGALVLVDGAHGIGHVEMDVQRLDPDFLVTNPYKWLFVPRGAAVVYVPARHQRLIRASVPTSARLRGVGDETPGAFISLFDYIAAIDNTNLLTIKAALDFRTEICGGEAAIRSYSQSIAREGASIASSILGTEVMDLPSSSSSSCMRDCNFANVRVPLHDIPPSHADQVILWLKTTGTRESGCYFQICFYRGVFWWRLSGTVYVDVEDFRKGAVVLGGLCERVARGEYLLS